MLPPLVPLVRRRPVGEAVALLPQGQHLVRVRLALLEQLVAQLRELALRLAKGLLEAPDLGALLVEQRVVLVRDAHSLEYQSESDVSVAASKAADTDVCGAKKAKVSLRAAGPARP